MAFEQARQRLMDYRKNREKEEEEEELAKLIKEPEPDEIDEFDFIDPPSNRWDFLTKSETVSAETADAEESEPRLSPTVTFVLYAIGQGFAIWIEFGMVYFIISMLVLIYWGTGRRKHGEMSAYSVFNDQCERLPGQMTAEHFERDVLRQRRT